MKNSIIVLCILFHSFQTVNGQGVQFICVNYLQDPFALGYYVNFQGYSGPNPITWDWDFSNGSTGNLQVVGSFFPYPGVYPVKLKVTHAGGLQDSIIHNLYVDSTTILCYYTGSTGIELHEPLSIDIFPNPFADLITIRNNAPGTQLEIFSVFGKSVFKQKLNLSGNTINLEFLANGIYFLKYSEMEKERVIKIVKQ